MTIQNAASEMAVLKGKLRSLRKVLKSGANPITKQRIRLEIGKTEEDLEKMERQYPEAAQLISG